MKTLKDIEVSLSDRDGAYHIVNSERLRELAMEWIRNLENQMKFIKETDRFSYGYIDGKRRGIMEFLNLEDEVNE